MVNTPEEKQKVEQLYNKYRKLMKFIALKMLKNEDKAEDAVSDALISLIENLDKIGNVDDKKTKAFVYTVIRCTALNHFNKDNRHASIYLEDIIHQKIDNTNAFEDIYLNIGFHASINYQQFTEM
ncbi:MAG: hypothetical protein IJ995_01150 [Clostridia bacterium]|nr:hypothetical protein [Clostridia bacterium]